MTNKPMLSFERELLERILDSIGFGEREELKAILDNQALESQYNGMTQAQAQAVSDGVDEILHDKPAAQHQGEAVAWVECSPAWLKAGGDCATAPRICVGRDGISHLHPAHSNAEQPAPVADHAQCEECKGWGYHENHHEIGGTECGECGGSGNATVAEVMVMPDRMKVEPFTTIDRGSKNYKAGYNAALSEVARLNEVKP